MSAVPSAILRLLSAVERYAAKKNEKSRNKFFLGPTTNHGHCCAPRIQGCARTARFLHDRQYQSGSHGRGACAGMVGGSRRRPEDAACCGRGGWERASARPRGVGESQRAAEGGGREPARGRGGWERASARPRGVGESQRAAVARILRSLHVCRRWGREGC